MERTVKFAALGAGVAVAYTFWQASRHFAAPDVSGWCWKGALVGAAIGLVV